ncbi:MAG: organic hydroperoxide resistance protein [Actinomycetota bacterium]
MNVIYTTTANATGDGRNGRSELEDGSISFDMRIPTEMGGPGGGPNPEQLFALGYAACFHSALKLIAGLDQSDVSDSEVSATVGFGQTPDGGFGLEVALDVSIPNLPPDQAQALVERAHEVCPYSNATRNNIEVALSVI